jgi:hypothetical protein
MKRQVGTAGEDSGQDGGQYEYRKEEDAENAGGQV